MKQVTLSLYPFSELPKESQMIALDKHRYINTEDDWWDFTYDNFIELMKTLCISVDKSSIYFNGFYSQGSGSCFAATANFTRLVQAANNKPWLEEFPMLEMFIPQISINRIIRLLDNNHLEVHPKVTSSSSDYHVTSHLIYEIIGNRSSYPRIEEYMAELDNWFTQVMETCNNLLYVFLQETYESFTSDEQVKETIEANEYEFTIDGQIATRLAILSEN